MSTDKRLIRIFDEWLNRYATNPEEFNTELLDEEGKPIEGYGERCAVYFEKLNNELT